MKNNFYKLYFVLFIFFVCSHANSAEQFNFNITEIEILDNGNKLKGTKRGEISSNNGIIINADEFVYDKKLNTLDATGNVVMKDNVNNFLIYTNRIQYFKNKNLILTEGNSKATNLEDKSTIDAANFEYDVTKNKLSATGNVVMKDNVNNFLIYTNRIQYFKNKNLILTEGNSKATNLEDKSTIDAANFEYDVTKNKLSATGNVVFKDQINDYVLLSRKIIYFKNEEKFITKGKTKALIDSRYNFESKDLTFLKKQKEISSANNTTVISNKNQLFNLSKFKYLINKEELRGEKVTIVTNYNLPNSDKFYIESGFFDLKNKKFIAKRTKLKLHKDIFGNSKNDPTLIGVSSKSEGGITVVNKGIFTSCSEKDDCPPWSLQADEIKHDKNKRELKYKNALLKIYNIPVLYFPKFFHPDPTVKRQSGFLKPEINNSNILSNSLSLPYFKVLSTESDYTFIPTLFDNSTIMAQNEYRKVGKNFDFIADFGFVNNYKSSSLGENKNINHLFSKFNYNLNFEEYNSSNLSLSLERVNNDSYLKVFEANINDSIIKPKNQDVLSSEIKIELDHDEHDFSLGFQSFENLQLTNNDRYQYILPYYSFNKDIFEDFDKGSISFNSNGSNDLNHTNNLKTKIINNFNFTGNEIITKNGLVNNINISFKNLNSLGKNSTEYKSSPQVELMSIFEFNSSLPLIKKDNLTKSILSPKLSFRFNPADMKNYSSTSRNINTNNIFSLNRFGLDDTLESGRSLTLGVDYRKEKLKDINKYFEAKLATVLRDKEENFIPKKTTLNKKTSNIYGSIKNNFSKNLSIDYKFAVDNDLNTFEYNDLGAKLTLNNFVTELNFIQENGEMGDNDILENSFLYNVDEKNKLSFNTRRNRKLNLTEYYDLVYEYKNDCLTAGLKYKKSYYEDRDLKPEENLFFTITLFPLTNFEQKVSQ